MKAQSPTWNSHWNFISSVPSDMFGLSNHLHNHQTYVSVSVSICSWSQAGLDKQNITKAVYPMVSSQLLQMDFLAPLTNPSFTMQTPRWRRAVLKSSWKRALYLKLRSMMPLSILLCFSLFLFQSMTAYFSPLEEVKSPHFSKHLWDHGSSTSRVEGSFPHAVREQSSLNQSASTFLLPLC